MRILTSVALLSLTLAQTPVPEAARTPIRVPGVDNVVDAAAGDHFFIVLRRDGTAMSWGANNRGQLGNGRIGATAGSEPGKTMPFVVQGVAEPIDGLTDAVGVAAGGEHALAVRRDGSVWGWGSNGSGQLALGRANRTGSPKPVPLPGIQRAVAVAARGYASYALLADGTVLGWGDSLWRIGNRAVASETPLPVPGVANAVAIRAGLPCLALLRDGHVVAWGTGYLGDGNPAQRDYASVVVPQPAQVQGVDDAVAIASGASRAGVVRKDGSVWVWGDNNLGALGLGKPAATERNPERLVPTRIAGVSNAVDLAMASGSSIVGADGSLRTWGDERLGATGRTGIERVAAPTAVPGVTTLVRVWGSSYSNLGLTRDGHLLAWGSVFVTP